MTTRVFFLSVESYKNTKDQNEIASINGILRGAFLEGLSAFLNGTKMNYHFHLHTKHVCNLDNQINQIFKMPEELHIAHSER